MCSVLPTSPPVASEVSMMLWLLCLCCLFVYLHIYTGLPICSSDFVRHLLLNSIIFHEALSFKSWVNRRQSAEAFVAFRAQSSLLSSLRSAWGFTVLKGSFSETKREMLSSHHILVALQLISFCKNISVSTAEFTPFFQVSADCFHPERCIQVCLFFFFNWILS